MTYATLGEYRRRRQRAVYLRVLQLALFVVALLGTASYAYQIGVSATQATAEKLRDRVERFQADNLALRDRLSTEVRRSGEARQALEVLEGRYRAEVPRGELRALMDGLEAQIESGVPPDRLALLIDLAGRPPVCDEQPETKRFMPSTPLGSGAVDAIRFAEGRILVRGEGVSAQNAAGLPEAWFDPTAAVRLTFSTIAGAAEEVRGVLPLRHRMIVGDVEYRFVIVSGERAFIEVTAQGCALPEAAPEQAGGAAADERLAVTSG